MLTLITRIQIFPAARPSPPTLHIKLRFLRVGRAMLPCPENFLPAARATSFASTPTPRLGNSKFCVPASARLSSEVFRAIFFFPLRGPFLVINPDTPLPKFEIPRSRERVFELGAVQPHEISQIREGKGFFLRCAAESICFPCAAPRELRVLSTFSFQGLQFFYGVKSLDFNGRTYGQHSMQTSN
ncbi:hypothetical protein R3P38DRAFT_3365226 [Favolaschia claudopus]|uniref:Ribosomal protein L5 n=1 Tax=Favolaschia claudopus TaxID=2862362 RepID=A0AAW0AHJ2_9AGAR